MKKWYLIVASTLLLIQPMHAISLQSLALGGVSITVGGVSGAVAGDMLYKKNLKEETITESASTRLRYIIAGIAVGALSGGIITGVGGAIMRWIKKPQPTKTQPAVNLDEEAIQKEYDTKLEIITNNFDLERKRIKETWASTNQENERIKQLEQARTRRDTQEASLNTWRTAELKKIGIEYTQD